MEKTRQRKANTLRELHDKTLSLSAGIAFNTSLDQILSDKLIRNYKSILSIIEKEANK